MTTHKSLNAFFHAVLELVLFAGLGNVCPIGDLNSRTGLVSDDNENDNIHQTLLENME